MQYNYKKSLTLPFNEVVQKTKQELSNEGFGVLMEIDISAVLKNKIGADYHECLILGACNPQLAYSSLLAESGVSMFLPCNVVIQKEGDQVSVGTILPKTFAKIIGNKKLMSVAKVVEERLKKVVDRVE